MTAQGYNGYPNTAYFERGFEAGGLGHRFVLLETERPARSAPDSTFVLKQKWANRNSGKARHEYPLVAYHRAVRWPRGGQSPPLMDKDFGQTMWMAGNTYKVFYDSPCRLMSRMGPTTCDSRWRTPRPHREPGSLLRAAMGNCGARSGRSDPRVRGEFCGKNPNDRHWHFGHKGGALRGIRTYAPGRGPAVHPVTPPGNAG